MTSGYQRNGNPESSTWRTTQDEFRGFVRAKMEDLSDDMSELKPRVKWLETKAQIAIGGFALLSILLTVLIALEKAGLI